MKRIFTLLLALSMAVLPLMAQEIDGSFVFVDESENIIENESTIVRNTIEEDEGMEFISSGVSVMNVSAGSSDFIRIIYTISQIDNGSFQICFPMNCNSQTVVGTYETGTGQLMGNIQNTLSEWIPTTDGSCLVTLKIEVMVKMGFSYLHKAYGPSINVKFVKGEMPGPDPGTLKGDVNGDGEVGIADVNSLIDMILNGKQDQEGDVNGDSEVGIADVNALIEIILNPPLTSQTFTVNGVTFKMIPVEGGTFTMGATADDSDAFDWEYPAHQVTLSSYSIGETEVTQALWVAVMGSNPSTTQGDVNLPVESVSWDDCQTFIAKLNQMTGMTGKQFRLPTEAEWEYAARGGNKSKNYRYAGSNDINEVAWWDGNACNGVGFLSSDYGTHVVASKKGNELGIYDMSGNVIS